jgi:hypothetical protein
MFRLNLAYYQAARFSGEQHGEARPRQWIIGNYQDPKIADLGLIHRHFSLDRGNVFWRWERLTNWGK